VQELPVREGMQARCEGGGQMVALVQELGIFTLSAAGVKRRKSQSRLTVTEGRRAMI
jgi:hypothetical protein